MNDTPPPSHRYSVALPAAKPIFTYLLLGTLVVVYILQALSEIITGDDLLFYFGGKINDFIIGGEYWRLLTPIFLHGSLAHLGSNALSLFIFGVRVRIIFWASSFPHRLSSLRRRRSRRQFHLQPAAFARSVRRNLRFAWRIHRLFFQQSQQVRRARQCLLKRYAGADRHSTLRQLSSGD